MRILIKVYIFLFAVILLSGCSKSVDSDSLWIEKIEFEDGSHIMLYHSPTCHKTKPFFAPTERMIDFVQYKYGVFDFCLEEFEIEALYAISKMNIKKKNRNFSIYANDFSDYEYHRHWINVVDTTYRQYNCFYSLKADSLFELNEAFMP